MSSRERREMREHVAKVAAMEEQVASLEAKNAELLEEFDKMDVWYTKELSYSISENDKLRELVRDVVLLAGVNGCDVTKMQLHVHGGDWRTIWERMSELGIEVKG